MALSILSLTWRKNKTRSARFLVDVLVWFAQFWFGQLWFVLGYDDNTLPGLLLKNYDF
jgi:hypothetical protein